MDSELKSKIDKIWLDLATAGLTNPLNVIEQITYLLFIKSLDELEITKEKNDAILGIKSKRIFDENHQDCRWSQFKNFDAPKMYQVMQTQVFPFIKQLSTNPESGYAKYMDDANCLIPTPIALQRLVASLDKLPTKEADTKGDLYEYMLSKLTTAKLAGQFRTPRNIIRMMVELMKPTPQDIICDPACGTAGFLVSAGEYLKENHADLFLINNEKEHYNKTMFYGFDTDRTMLRIGAMNLMQHGIEQPNIEYVDSVSQDNEEKAKYTMILANPPFTGSVDDSRISKDLLAITKTKKTELLFLSLFIRLLKNGGRCASIVPDGVLFGNSNAHKSLRKELVENHKLEAVISMPSGIFMPYAGVSTGILIFTKTGQGGTDKVWFYDMTADGFSLDAQRNPIKDNDIPDIIARFHNRNSEEEQNRARTEKSFFVSVDEIKENDYDLSINKYKEIIYTPPTYDKPLDIIKRISIIENELQQNISELEAMLNEKV